MAIIHRCVDSVHVHHVPFERNEPLGRGVPRLSVSFVPIRYPLNGLLYTADVTNVRRHSRITRAFVNAGRVRRFSRRSLSMQDRRLSAVRPWSLMMIRRTLLASTRTRYVEIVFDVYTGLPCFGFAWSRMVKSLLKFLGKRMFLGVP